MRKTEYNNDIYNMYEEQYSKNLELTKENKTLKLEVTNLKYELDYLQKSTQNKIEKMVHKATEPLQQENSNLKNNLDNAYKEIERLKKGT